MKKTFLILVTVMMAGLAAHANVTINSTNFPDANFRAYLMSEYPSGIITTAQLNARDSLYLYNKGISNMKGVEYFTQLTYLNCYSNNLSSIDVSSNTKLKYINVGNNKLTSINVAANTALQQLYLQHNSFSSSITVTDHSALRTLWVNENPNLTGLYCWRNNLTNFDVSGCTALQQLKCYNNANLSSITGIADCTALTWLDVEDCSFTDLNFVDGLTHLATFLASNNKITSLEVTGIGSLVDFRVNGNKQLTDLKCNSNGLTTLQVQGCTALKKLQCYYNYHLTEITGLATCTALTYLDCDKCPITDLSMLNSFPNIETVYCRYTKITSLTISEKTMFKNLYAEGNTLLKTLICNNDNLTTLEVKSCTALEKLYCYANSNLTTITGFADCVKMTYLWCNNCALTNLDGTSSMMYLVDVRCNNNNLTSLNVFSRLELVTLYCQNNKLTSLNINGCPELKDVLCGGNNLTTFTASGYPKLERFDISGCTRLTELSVFNNSQLNTFKINGNTGLTELSCFFNARLATITGLGDCTALKTLYCYDNALTTLDGINNLNAIEVVYCSRNKLTSLELSNKRNLTYLDCHVNPTMTYLKCTNNKLNTLDITGNTGLTELRCYYNANLATITGLADCKAITYLDCEDDKISDLYAIEDMTNLQTLLARNNQLSGTIDITSKSKLTYVRLSGNTSLTRINCYNNPLLTTLDVSNCTGMTILSAWNNKLTDLDVTNCTAMYELSCRSNQLESLSLSTCTALKSLYCYSNQLSELDLKKNTKLALLYCYRNKISGAKMDALIASLVTRQASSPGSFRVISSSGENNVITGSQVNTARKKYWIPMRYNGTEWVEIEASIPGDVNGDNEVNIADVNALIDLILKHQSTNVADVNGDGEVNIADVNALIDMILQQ